MLNRLENGFNNFILTRLCRCSKFTSIWAWNLDKNGSLCCRIHCIHFHYWDAQLIPDDCFRECGNNNGETMSRKTYHPNDTWNIEIRIMLWMAHSESGQSIEIFHPTNAEKNRLIFTISPTLLNLSVMCIHFVLMCFFYFGYFFPLFANDWFHKVAVVLKGYNWNGRTSIEKFDRRKKQQRTKKINKEPIEMLSIQSISWMLVFLLSLSLAP